MPDLCPKGIDLSMKCSTPSCPPTLTLYPGFQTEKTERQETKATPPQHTHTPGRVALVSVEAQTETQVALVSVKAQTGIQTAQVQVQRTPVSVQLQTILVSIETQTIKIRKARQQKLWVKYRMRWREGDKEIKKSRFLQSIPGAYV